MGHFTSVPGIMCVSVEWLDLHSVLALVTIGGREYRASEDLVIATGESGSAAPQSSMESCMIGVC